MNVKGHIESLVQKHQRLDQQINTEVGRPNPDQNIVSRLKKEKLRIKEEITTMEML